MILYTDIDEKCCAWMRELVKGGHIPVGDVKCASIKELDPDELRTYIQVHLFCGIAGWPYALQLAEWPIDRPVWTGSCPCQPFSAAGKRKGTADERHLWPDMFRLIRECNPPIVFGEQVASKDGLGWLDGVFADLEGAGCACGAADTCAAGVGAPHIRQRLYWVANAIGEPLERRAESRVKSGEAGSASREARQRERRWFDLGGCGTTGWLADAEHAIGRAECEIDSQARGRDRPGRGGATGGVEHAPRNGRQQGRAESSGRSAAGGCCAGGLGFTGGEGQRGARVQIGRAGQVGRASEVGGSSWDRFELVACRDPRGGPTLLRRIEPGTFPLAHGLPARVVRLRGYGNAIVPQVAAAFVEAVMNSAAEIERSGT